MLDNLIINLTLLNFYAFYLYTGAVILQEYLVLAQAHFLNLGVLIGETYVQIHQLCPSLM